MSEKVVLDGQEVDKRELEKAIHEANANPKKRVKEISPGVYKTLERLYD